MPEEMGERTEAPSAKRRGDARERGQVAKSPDLSAGLELVGAFIMLLVVGSSLVAGLGSILRYLLDSRLSGSGTSFVEIEHAIEWASAHAGILTLPLMAVMFAVALLGQILQVGFHLSSEVVTINFERLNPLNGIGRIFSRRSLIKTISSLLKLALAAVIVVLIVRSEWENIAGLAILELRPAFMSTLLILVRVCTWLLSVILIVGLADFAFQRWQLTQDLRMTKQEVKEEHRQMEGDTNTKGRRLRMARQVAVQRLRQAVPKADVVVTNPTHFAVALRYEAGKSPAPKVVAKGVDFLAFRIREIAAANNIPIIERPPLARAIYHGVPVGKQISPEFYEAVAEILAYVYRVSGKAA